MNLEQIVKETVAKIVAEKELTAAEEKKREEIVKAMKKDFKGPAPAMYAIATDKAKKLAEEGDHEVSMAQRSLNSILRSAMELKAKIGSNEIDIPAWIQDHITNSENFIDQASQGYHEYSNGGHEGKEMNEARVSQDNVVSYLANALQSVWAAGKGNNSIDFQDFAQSLYFDMFGGDEMNEGYNSEQSAIESASGDKITGTEEDDYGNTLYIGQDPYDQYFIVNGEIKHDNFQKGIKSVTIGMLKHYGDGQNHSADDDMYEAFKPKSSFDDYKIGDNVTVAGKKAKITNMKIDDESGERRARVRFEDGTAEEISINTIDENIMTTNEGRSAEDLKQGQLDQAYSHLEKIKEKPKLFSSEDIKKAEARIEKLEAELDALAAKATNESLDEATVRRWQHYAGIK